MLADFNEVLVPPHTLPSCDASAKTAPFDTPTPKRRRLLLLPLSRPKGQEKHSCPNCECEEQGDSAEKSSITKHCYRPRLEKKIRHRSDQDESPAGWGINLARSDQLGNRECDGVHVGQTRNDCHKVQPSFAEVFLGGSHA